ncbi:MAG: ATP-binding protein, partial [Bdellovibrionota bacterium]
VQISLFAVLLVGVILRSTWQAARISEQEELRAKKAYEQQQIFAAFVENSSDFIGIADARGVPFYVNPSGRRMVALPPEIAVEKTQIPEYYPADQREFASEVIVRAMVEQGHWKGETYFRNWSTEESIPVSDSHFMITEPGSGKILGMGTITRDISDLRRAEEALRRANTLLVEMQRMREEWTSVIAHDLRQPIGVIGISAELLPSLHTGEMDEKERATGERIRMAASSLSRMVDDLLDVSLLEAHRLSINRQWTDPRRIVRETIERLSHVTSGFHVSVVETGPRGEVFADRGRIEQVLGNLLSNAAKYGEKGSEIRIEIERGERELEFSVTNRGPGIPLEDISRLFSRFSRSKSTRASGVHGLGLGLYISKGLIEAHGGKIWVESIPGETTTVHFTLPLKVEAGREAA